MTEEQVSYRTEPNRMGSLSDFYPDTSFIQERRVSNGFKGSGGGSLGPVFTRGIELRYASTIDRIRSAPAVPAEQALCTGSKGKE